MKSRKFTAKDHQAFSICSGDYNPIHLDDIIARRLLFGGTVTHGIHLVLWSIDTWLSQNGCNLIELDYIHAIFYKPVKTDEYVELKIYHSDNEIVQLSIYSNEELHAKIDIRFSKVIDKSTNEIYLTSPPMENPIILTIDGIEGKNGNLSLFLDEKNIKALFPNVLKRLKASQLAAILATTRLVGNKCPGYHSIYTELVLHKISDAENSLLEYAIKKADKRFGMIKIGVIASNLSGSINAFFRPSSHSQPPLKLIKKHVTSHEFSDQRALIIGGSRGLGEMTFKILAAGGADVRLTYYKGASDALRVLEETDLSSFKFKAFQLDVLSPLDLKKIGSQLSDWKPTHLYYYATPHIKTGNPNNFSQELFKIYYDYYVHALQKIIHLCKNLNIKYLFNPSTIFIDQETKNLIEYTKAKELSEKVSLSSEEIFIYHPRIPKMHTDQTAKIISNTINNYDGDILVMLNFIRKFIAP